MSIEVRMPALSPTMEKGTLAKWLVKEGDIVGPGDLLAEIETDKATMEFEIADGGRVTALLVKEGTEDIPVGTVLALLADASAEPEVPAPVVTTTPAEAFVAASLALQPLPLPTTAAKAPLPSSTSPDRPAEDPRASPLAARMARAMGLDLSAFSGSGPGGRILRKDLGLSPPVVPVAPSTAPVPTIKPEPRSPKPEVPHDTVKLSSMRKTIAQRLTESKQQVPHIYLMVDIEIDALVKLRSDLNETLVSRGVRLSINDLVIKALALALIEVPACNVQFAGNEMIRFHRADISVAVSIPNGLITPVIVDAGSKSLSTIATEAKDLASRAREGKLQPHEYQGGTASLSNLGMFGIKQFDAIINPPQAMIMAIGAGEDRMLVRDGQPRVASVFTATGGFDHRAIDGADAARLMQAFKRLIETPMLIAS